MSLVVWVDSRGIIRIINGPFEGSLDDTTCTNATPLMNETLKYLGEDGQILYDGALRYCDQRRYVTPIFRRNDLNTEEEGFNLIQRYLFVYIYLKFI